MRVDRSVDTTAWGFKRLGVFIIGVNSKRGAGGTDRVQREIKLLAFGVVVKWEGTHVVVGEGLIISFRVWWAWIWHKVNGVSIQ